MTYLDWIKANVKETYGMCDSVTQAMAAAFPELERIRGHYHCHIWGERAHWWLVTDGGEIVDPTAEQFPSKGTGTYTPWAEGASEPTGICMNCGDYVYDGECFCSERCKSLVMADLHRRVS